MKKMLKVAGYLLLSIVVLLLVLALCLQTHWAKNLIRDKLQTYLQHKTHTTFEIGQIDFSFPKWIEIEDLFILDRAKDTLVLGKHLKIDVDMIALIQSKYLINKVEIDQFYVNIYNSEADSTYNYQFIVDAFTSPKTSAKEKDTTAVLNLKMKDIDVSNSQFTQKDEYSGNFMDVSIQKFHLNVDKIDLKKYQIDIHDCNVEGVDFRYLITKIAKPSSGESPNPIFTIHRTLIQNSHVYFENKPDYMLTDNNIQYLDIVDLNNTAHYNTYSTSSIVLNNSSFLFQYKTENKVVKVVADTLIAIANNHTSLGIVIKDIRLQNNSVIYNNISQAPKLTGFDYYHLDIKGLKLLASNIKFNNGNIKTNIQSFGFKDKSGFEIDSLSGLFNLDSSNVNIRDFYVATAYSKIAAAALIYPQSFLAGGKQKLPLPENEISLSQAIISQKDIELLADAMLRTYKKPLQVLGDFSIEAHVKGNVHKMSISSLVVHSLRNKDVSVDLTGDVSNPMDIKQLSYDLNVKNLSTSQEFIALFIPKSTEPLHLPNRLSIKGLIKGNIQNVNTDITLNSDFGNADIKADLKEFQIPKKMVFDVALKSNNLETANWIGDEKKLGLVRGEIDLLGNVSIHAQVKGTLNKIPYLVFNSLKNNDLSIDLTGDVSNPSDTKQIAYNLNVKNISASKQLITLYIPKSTQAITLPNLLSIKGLIKGDLQNVNTDIKLNSDFGTAGIKADLKGFQTLNEMVYDVVLNAENLETGKWVGRDTMLGLLNGEIKVKGNRGFEVKTNNMYVLADIQTFRFNQNVIHTIKSDLNLNSGIISGTASIEDALINILFDGTANIQSDYPSATALVNVANADLLALGLTKDSLIVRAFTRLKVENTSPQQLNALIQIDSSVITYGAQKVAFDSTRVEAFVRNDTTFIAVASPFLDAQLKSTVYYNQMEAFIQQVIHQFVPPAMATNVPIDNKNAQNTQSTEGYIHAAIFIKPNDIYSNFVKDLKFDKAMEINGNITTANTDSAVNVTLNLPSLTMGSLHVSPTLGTILGRNDSLLVNIKTDTLQASSFLLYDARINGGFSKNQVSAAILTHDINKKDQYALSVFAVPNNEKGYDISLGKNLLLNKIKWLVNDSNQVKTNPEGFNVQNFVVRNEQQQIKVNNETAAINSPLLVNISHFQLNTITALLDKNTLSAEGLLNVNLKVSDLKNTIPTMDGDIKIDTITFQHTRIGNLDIHAQSENGNVNIEGKLFGDGNEVNLKGGYAENKIDANIQLNPLTMTTIESFSLKNIKNSTGTITGDINITGEPTKPIWDGEIVFHNAQTTSAEYGTFVKIDNQTLRLKHPSVFFDRFALQDGVNHTLLIDGSLSQTKANDFTSDVKVQSQGFRVLNNTAADNQMIYGTAFVDIDAQVSGNLLSPNVTGNVVVKNGTDLTYVRQFSPPSAKEREGLIEFIDRDTIDNLLATLVLKDTLLQETEKTSSFNFNLNLEVENEAKFIVIVDPISDDELQVQGTAHINAGVNPNGSIGLVGTYDLSKGSYELNYQFIKRKFNLLEGSVITLSGDPMQADVDITAAYDVKTAAIDLIKNEIGGDVAANNEMYKRKTPFRVLLKIKGKVDKLEIGFDIILPEKAEGVTSEMESTINNKLVQLRADPSSMNKQVFAILILNKFIGEQSNDFFASNNVGNTILNNESVSSFLNGAINQIANDLIKGVDVDLNLKNVADDPNAQRTDLSVALGKNFLDDRLNISVGKSFTVDGTNPASNNNTNAQYIPDVNTTYKLSKDGRFMIRAYRKNQYEAMLDGYFIETGVSFNFTVDYDKLREVTQKKKAK